MAQQGPHDGLDEPQRYVCVGDVIAGKYLVERTLGSGGMAFVLSARHLELDELFALKFLNRELLRERAVVERFMREARAACKIRSEHVARVHDVGTHEGAPFIVMEHLTGHDLASVLGDRGALGIEDAVEYAIQTCDALAAAHDLGIVHRDIKPENLFLVRQGEAQSVKLLDFGISKTALTGGEASSRLTGELTLGTPCYMSPEQIRSTTSADAQSDLWSLAVVLYELLTGVQAFDAPTVTEICAAVLETTPPAIRELRPEVPPELEEVVATAMHKDRARRYQDVRELAEALLPFAPERAPRSSERASLKVRRTAPPSSGMVYAASPTPTSWTPTTRLPVLEIVGEVTPPPAPRRTSRFGWLAAAAAVVVIGSAALTGYGRLHAARAAALGATGAPLAEAGSGASGGVAPSPVAPRGGGAVALADGVSEGDVVDTEVELASGAPRDRREARAALHKVHPTTNHATPAPALRPAARSPTGAGATPTAKAGLTTSGAGGGASAAPAPTTSGTSSTGTASSNVAVAPVAPGTPPGAAIPSASATSGRIDLGY